MANVGDDVRSRWSERKATVYQMAHLGKQTGLALNAGATRLFGYYYSGE